MSGKDRILFALSLMAAVTAGCDGGQSTEGTGGKGGEVTSTSTSGGGGSGGSDGGGGSGGGGAGGALTCPAGEGQVLAVSELSFGEGDNGEWKKVGVNIDGLVSTALSDDVCQPNAGAEKSTPYPDGDDGIDNSFGKNLLPLILPLYPDWVQDINNGIKDGYFTSLLKLECLPPEGDVPALVTKAFGGTELGSMPTFDGSDIWPVAPELLSDPMDPLSSTVVFPKSSVLGQDFDSQKNQTFILTVPLNTMADNTSIKLTLYAAQVTMTLAADRKSATNGVISGVVNTEELVTEVKKIGALLGLCGTSAFNNIIDEVRRASDIMADGTQNPRKTCDGISIGLGFKMLPAQIGGVGPVAPVGMTCP
jgi:hypothetical protein